MGAGASSADKEIVVGDVVTVKLRDHDTRVIGVVTAIQEDACSVQVSVHETLERISRNDVKRIASWSAIEVGDIVKVKEDGSKLYYEANVVSRNDDGTFKVKFGDDEIEDDVSIDRMIKLMTGRLEHKEWMMYKEE